MTLDISGKRVLITGASSGLGAHFAQVMAREGARVAMAARRIDRLEVAAGALREAGADVTTIALDVACPDSIDQAVNGLVGLWGGIDVLVNNAGVTRTKPAMDYNVADFDDIVDVNLRGAFLVAQRVGRAMRDQAGGSIVNVASILGLRQAGQVASYAISKAGIVQLTKVLGLEWARHGIRVNALAPGYLETELNEEFWQTAAGQAMIKRIPQRRLGALQDLDAPLLLLSSEASSYMTGAVIVVDGGHTVSTL
ncbi:MAG: glucose 1-dehydrogenase [Novosphingobium sp.]